MFFSLLFSFFLLLCTFMVFKWKKGSMPDVPGLLEITLLGHLHILKSKPGIAILTSFQDLLSGLTVLHQKDGMFKLRMGFKNYVCLTSPETTQTMLNHKTELRKGDSYATGAEYLGNGLVTSPGDDRWKIHRKVLGPGFHLKSLHELYLPSMNTHSQKLVEILLKNVNKEYVDMSELVDNCTFDVIMESGMGLKLNAQEIGDVKYQNMMKMLTETWVERPLKPWLMNKTIFSMTEWGKEFQKNVKGTLEFARKAIEQKKKRLNIKEESYEQPRKTFIDLVIDEQVLDENSFTDREVIDETNTFIGTGYDTSAYSTMWALYLIGLHPAVQSKIHDELDAIFGTNTGSPVSPEDLMGMKYIEAVIRETMRLYPTIPMIVRDLQNDMLIDGKRLLRGTSVIVYIWAVHRHPDFYKNPEEFDPERDFPDKAYIPFSGGLRNCIGRKFGLMEIKVILANILRHVRITSLDPRDKVVYVPGVVGRPSGQLRMKIESRVH